MIHNNFEVRLDVQQMPFGESPQSLPGMDETHDIAH
jgi:hypothetical protein